MAGGAPPGAAATAVPGNTAAVSRNANPPESPHSIPPFAGPSAVRIGACHPGSHRRWIPAPARMAARGVNLADTRRWPRCVAAPPRGAALQPRAAGRPRKHKRNSPRVHASAGRCQPQAARRSAPSQNPHRSSAVRRPNGCECRAALKGARDAPWCTVPLQPARHLCGAVKVASPGLPSVLCGSCHGAKRRTSWCLPRSPPHRWLCDTGARATAHRGRNGSKPGEDARRAALSVRSGAPSVPAGAPPRRAGEHAPYRATQLMLGYDCEVPAHDVI